MAIYSIGSTKSMEIFDAEITTHSYIYIWDRDEKIRRGEKSFMVYLEDTTEEIRRGEKSLKIVYLFSKGKYALC